MCLRYQWSWIIRGVCFFGLAHLALSQSTNTSVPVDLETFMKVVNEEEDIVTKMEDFAGIKTATQQHLQESQARIDEAKRKYDELKKDENNQTLRDNFMNYLKQRSEEINKRFQAIIDSLATKNDDLSNLTKSRAKDKQDYLNRVMADAEITEKNRLLQSPTSTDNTVSGTIMGFLDFVKDIFSWKCDLLRRKLDFFRISNERRK